MDARRENATLSGDARLEALLALGVIQKDFELLSGVGILGDQAAALDLSRLLGRAGVSAVPARLLDDAAAFEEVWFVTLSLQPAVLPARYCV
jgi:hypothetical protein